MKSYSLSRLRFLFPAILVFSCPAVCFAASGTAGSFHETFGKLLPLWTMAPFAGILLSIALGPLLFPHVWHHHYGKISACWALLFCLPFLIAFRGNAFAEIIHILVIDYFPFIILLWGLFTIAGGIVISGTRKGTPQVNTAMLLVGTVLASVIGTTGASMIMIRPILRANKDRIGKTHIVCFFIFLIANIGGALTPLGDPPLFLGFLHNVPFFWVTLNILPHMLIASGLLLAAFFAVDSFYYRREPGQESPGEDEKTPLRIEGAYNLVFLAGVIGFILMSGWWKPGYVEIAGIEIHYQNLLRDAGIAAMGVLSLIFTPWKLREANEFGWAPMLEVAKIFAGIFITIIPALAILKAGSEGALSSVLALIKSPADYFWMSGALSSFLDNAPTYLSFFNMALGNLGMTEAMVPAACDIGNPSCNPLFIEYLKAISAGSVFMGANSYIGNAPNFMVKSIAEEAGVPMPSFFGYMFKYSIPFLIPIFVLITYILF
jgi:Na+/H+ antiporter NhaD/arsenite permease-like protein